MKTCTSNILNGSFSRCPHPLLVLRREACQTFLPLLRRAVHLSNFQLAVFGYYIAVSAAGPLLIKLSERSLTLEYNVTAAVVLTELLKLVAVLVAERRERSLKPYYGTETVTWQQWAWYGVPSLM